MSDQWEATKKHRKDMEAASLRAAEAVRKTQELGTNSFYERMVLAHRAKDVGAMANVETDALNYIRSEQERRELLG